MTKLEKLRDELAIKHEPYGTININTNAENDFKSGWDECDKHWRAHCEELVEAFKSCEAAMAYAFEDRADQYYMNVLKKYKDAIKKHEEFLGE